MFNAYILFLIAVLACGIIDLWTYRIPNLLTLPLLATGIIIQTASGNYAALAYGFLLGFGIGLIGVLVGGMGGGDMKLMAAIGAWLGPQNTWEIVFLGAIIGAIWGISKMFKNGILKEHLSGFWRGVLLFPALGFNGLFKTVSVEEGSDIKKAPHVIPFGTCLSIALVLKIILVLV